MRQPLTAALALSAALTATTPPAQAAPGHRETASAASSSAGCFQIRRIYPLKRQGGRIKLTFISYQCKDATVDIKTYLLVDGKARQRKTYAGWFVMSGESAWTSSFSCVAGSVSAWAEIRSVHNGSGAAGAGTSRVNMTC